MDDVLSYLAAHRADHLARLKRLCAQPSISAQHVGVRECADLLARMMREVGLETRLVELGGAPPLVVGERAGRSPKTLLIYGHYDVQPVDPLDQWESPPFEPTERNGRLYARGACDTKGNIAARLAAVDAWLRVRGELPVGVRFVVEGEEEVGSPHLPAYVARERDLVRADGCLWESGNKDHSESPMVYLGAKGICYLEITAHGAGRDMHSSLATIVPNPAWRLLWALATFKGRDERVLIEGFYDDVVPPTDEEMAQLRRLAAQQDQAAQLRELGLDHYLLGLAGVELVKRHLFEPTCTICGIVSGYTGEGSKTVLPHVASTKIDFRLVPNQRAADIAQKVRAHLASHGFADFEVREHGNEDPAKTSPDSAIARAVIETGRTVYGRDPLVMPLMAATGPMAVICGPFGVPAVGAGVGYAGARVHAPNEHIRLDDFYQGTDHAAMILEAFAEGAA